MLCIDPAWEQGFLLDTNNMNKVQCKYCPKIVCGVTS
uniref:Uncharacterized protein n=1 Tax=Arundo donax TaxID=35708 RepID=A0A0A9ATH6_ARUDO